MPTITQIIDRIEDPVFELVFQSESQIASLVINPESGVGVAFWYYEHEEITWGRFFYQSKAAGDNWVSVCSEDSLELIKVFDGQCYSFRPRMFYVDEEKLEPVLEHFVQFGTRCSEIKWELDHVVIDRLGSMGCFDDVE